MIAIESLAQLFSIEEQQQFVHFLEAKNKRNDSKNIQLFKLLLKANLPSEELCLKLYPSNNKAAYHALRKRLMSSLVEFMANVSLSGENSVQMHIIKHLLASRTLFFHNQFKLGYKLLDKAESIALEHNLFSLLSEIYHTKIQYAHHLPSLNLNELMEKFEANLKNKLLEDRLNIVYAKIRQALNRVAYKGEVIDFQTLLETIFKEQSIEINNSLSFKSLYQLMAIVSISAFVTNDYLQIESFLIRTYSQLEKRKGKQLFYHIQVLYFIANTLFRNKKFELSQEYLEQMHQQMLLGRKKYYRSFKLKHHLLLALNYNFSNWQEKAIELLESIKDAKHEDTEAILDIHLSLMMFYFQNKDFKKAHGILSKFYHTDKWYVDKAGIEWVIKKNLAEILLHLELNNIDLVESRLKSFKRNHFRYLKQINQDRAVTYVKLIEAYYKNPFDVTSDEFKEKVENSFVWLDAKQEDIFVMSFYAWLKSKMEKADLYETTIKLVEKARIKNVSLP